MTAENRGRAKTTRALEAREVEGSYVLPDVSSTRIVITYFDFGTVVEPVAAGGGTAAGAAAFGAGAATAAAGAAGLAPAPPAGGAPAATGATFTLKFGPDCT